LLSNSAIRAGFAVTLSARRRHLDLHQIEAITVAAYVEQLGSEASKPTVKQHLAAIRQLFDYLTTGGILEVNPAASVHGPKYVVKRGKTPVLSAEEARKLIDSIESDTLIGLRDRALIGIMVYSFARVGAAITMKVGDFFQHRQRWWLRLHEKGAKRHEVPCHEVLLELTRFSRRCRACDCRSVLNGLPL
jgi:integrase/recombinase XerD